MKSQSNKAEFSPDHHAPLYLESPMGKGLVIFVHGFMGSPRQFDRLAEVVHSKGYSAASLLLPGHGGSAKDFISSTFIHWQNHVNCEVERFIRDYENIWLVGHSMGGLLAINSAIRYNSHIRGLFTIATPFKLVTFSVRATRVFMHLLFSRKSSPMKTAYFAGCGVHPSASLFWRALRPVTELRKLTHFTKDNLPNVRAPVTAVFSVSDELTSMGSLNTFITGLTGTVFDQVLLSDSLHVYYPEHEFTRIEQALVSMVLA